MSKTTDSYGNSLYKMYQLVERFQNQKCDLFILYYDYILHIDVQGVEKTLLRDKIKPQGDHQRRAFLQRFSRHF